VSSSFHQRLEGELDRRKKDSLFRSLEVGGSSRLNLSSNDYLQLRNHPQVIAAARKTLDEEGSSSSASPLLSGYLPVHESLLQKLLQWKQMSNGLLFNTGFMANQAVLKHLPGPKDLILVDRLIHHSVIQGILQSQAEYKRYRHIDLGHLEELLTQHSKDYETIFVVTESVFSMDGDYPDLKAMAELKTRFPFVWVLDEAHGTGVFGTTGGGLAEEMGVLKDVDILVGTLGKALASMGAYILAHSQTVTDYLVNYSGEFIYSTYLAPTCAGAATAAIDLIQGMDGPRKKLRKNAAWFREELKNSGWSTNDYDSQIIPIIAEEPGKVMAMKAVFKKAGVEVGAVRPPTVPPNSSRLRLSFHSNVTRENMDEILEILATCRKR